MPRPGSLGGDPASPMARPTMGQPLPATSQRTQVVATGATAGTFTLRIQGRGNTLDVTTAAINWNDSLAQLVAKIDAVLNPLGLDSIGVSGGPLPAASVVEFSGGESFTVTAGNQGTMVGGTAVVSQTQAATGFVLPAGPTRTPGNNKPSAMARPRLLGRR
jgi:hypothetical protein